MAKQLPALTIPVEPSELSCEWLTAALRSGGFLPVGRVAGFETEILDGDQGFVGTIARLRLELDPHAVQGPRSLIAKFPMQVAQNKSAGELTGAYEREIRFYRELAPRVPITVPDCYYADMDPNPLAGNEEKMVAFFERFPDWLIRWLMPTLAWLAGRSKRRYVLLLEDLAPAPMGDQVAGCTVAQAKVAVRAIAGLHARFWSQVETPELSYLPRSEAMSRFYIPPFRNGLPVFEQRFAPKLPREVVEVVRSFEEHGDALVHRFAKAPRTLLHGDFRLDNLCLRGDGDDFDIVTFDWQTLARGPGVFDLAYFVAGSLPPGTAAEVEPVLVTLYKELLLEAGVADYPEAELAQDYDRAKLVQMYRTIMSLEVFDFAQGRAARLIETWIERQAALLPRAVGPYLD